MMSTVTLVIERLAFGGAGVGRVAGKACFVPFTAPGDRVRVRITSDRRSYLLAELLELLEPSSLRVSPPCPVYGNCGGCSWQHLAYGAQCAEKERIFAETLQRIARLVGEVLDPLGAAPEPFGYRSRVQFKVRWHDERLHLGFYRGGSHFVIDLPGACAIANPRINVVCPELRELLQRFPERDRVPQVDLAVGDDGATLLTIHYIGQAPERALAYFQRHRAELPGVDGAFLQTGRKATLRPVFGISELSYRLPDPGDSTAPPLRLTFGAGAFSQVNYRQNSMLVETVLAWATLTGRERVLDIYCGMGNFSLPLARRAAAVLGLEDFGPAIVAARQNARANGIDNASFRCAEAQAGLEVLHAGGERWDLVVLDPPRSGAREVATLLPRLGAAQIIYVSCDPATLARDLAILRTGGYRVVRSRAVDMFPQTYHIESVTLLEPLR
jgi:23S rRNA (uracil1939-C5)-methyltransferase